MSGRSRRVAEQARRNQVRATIGVAVGVVLVIVVMVVVVAAGGSSDSTSGGKASVISMTEMKFTPDPIDLPRTDARLRIVNDGAVPHSFIVPELGKGTPDLDAGAEMTLDLTAVPAGTYTVICDIPGHREAGMETTLTLR
jgi:plastocyanin